jgi:hypothetical protein
LSWLSPDLGAEDAFDILAQPLHRAVASLMNDAAYRLSVPFLDEQPRTTTSLPRLAFSTGSVAPPRFRFDVDDSWNVLGTVWPPSFASTKMYACGFS